MVLKVIAFGGAAASPSTLVNEEQSRVTSRGSTQVSGEESEVSEESELVSEESEGYREHLSTGLR